jgi:hypothetical protein
MRYRFAAAALLTFAATLTPFVVATPAQAATVSLYCESVYEDFVCDLDVTGVREIRRVRWVVHGTARPEFNDLGSIVGHCPSNYVSYPALKVRASVTVLTDEQVQTTFERSRTFSCYCTE